MHLVDQFGLHFAFGTLVGAISTKVFTALSSEASWTSCYNDLSGVSWIDTMYTHVYSEGILLTNSLWDLIKVKHEIMQTEWLVLRALDSLELIVAISGNFS